MEKNCCHYCTMRLHTLGDECLSSSHSQTIYFLNKLRKYHFLTASPVFQMDWNIKYFTHEHSCSSCTHQRLRTKGGECLLPPHSQLPARNVCLCAFYPQHFYLRLRTTKSCKNIYQILLCLRTTGVYCLQLTSIKIE